MIIERLIDGHLRKFSLTSVELRAAYDEQEIIYAHADVGERLAEFAEWETPLIRELHGLNAEVVLEDCEMLDEIVRCVIKLDPPGDFWDRIDDCIRTGIETILKMRGGNCPSGKFIVTYRNPDATEAAIVVAADTPYEAADKAIASIGEEAVVMNITHAEQ